MSKTITRKYIQRITKREGNTSIRQSGGGGGGGGGASQYWVEENYISKLFFNQLFTVYDEDGNVVEPNDTESVIASIKSMFGFWTDAYLSALGNGEGGGAELTLDSLADVDVHGVANGQALVYDATTQKWVPGQGGGIDITAMWAALAQSGVQQIDVSHLATALTGYATETWVGNQGYITGSALNGYATESWVGSQISDMATQTWVSGNYLSKTDAAATYLTQTNAAATYLTKTDAATTYVSIAFFERLFKAYNGSTVVHPNNTTSTIDNIKAMFGFWTDFYLSALGNGSGGSTPGVTMAQVWSALGNSTTEQINISHLTTALGGYNPTSNFKTINGNSIIGTGDIVVSGGGGTVTSIKVGTTSYSPTDGVVSLPDYLKISGGALTGNITTASFMSGTDRIGVYIEGRSTEGFRIQYNKSTESSSYDQLLMQNGTLTFNGNNIIDSSSISSQSVSSAAQLTTTRKLWGQDFNGTADVNGNIMIDSTAVEQVIDFKKNGTYRNEIDSGDSALVFFSYTNAWRADMSIARATGYVGIGTLSPTYNLHVNGTLGVTGTITQNGTTYTNINYITVNGSDIGWFGAGNNSNSTGIQLWCNDYFEMHTGNSMSNKFRFSSDGKLGVGTESPVATLDVRGTTYATGDVKIGSGSSNAYLNLDRYSDGGIVFKQAGTNKYQFSNDDDGYMYLWDYSVGRVCVLMRGTTDVPLEITSNSTSSYIGFYDKTKTILGWLGYDPNGVASCYENNTRYDIIHSGSIGSQSVASAAQLTTSRSLWGNSFNGTADIDGNISSSSKNFWIGGDGRGMYLEDSSHKGVRLQYSRNSNFSGYQSLSVGSVLQYNSSTSEADLELRLSDTNRCQMSYSDSGIFFFVNNGSWRTAMVITKANTPYVGIGTSSPSYLLHVNGTFYARGNSSIGGTFGVTGATTLSSTLGVSGATTLSSSLSVTGNSTLTGYVGIGTAASSSYALKVSGVAYASTGFYSGGYVTALSDARHKDVKGDVGLTVREVANAPAVRFLWKDRRQEGLQVGSIAQYWQKVMPEAIVKNADGELTMSYGVIALMASIATARKVEDHERRIRELEEENKKLKQQLNAA